MKKAPLISLLAITIGLVGCSKSDEDVIVSACVASDEASQAFCTCSYDQMEAALPPETLEAIAREIREGTETTQAAIARLPAEQQVQTLNVMPLLLNCVGAE